MLLFGIISATILAEVLQLTTQLYDKLHIQNPDIQLVMDKDRFQFVNIIPMEEDYQVIQSKDEKPMTELEEKIITGIAKAIVGSKTKYPPKLNADATTITDYNNLFSYMHYSTTSLHYEIGRVLYERLPEITINKWQKLRKYLRIM